MLDYTELLALTMQVVLNTSLLLVLGLSTTEQTLHMYGVDQTLIAMQGLQVAELQLEQLDLFNIMVTTVLTTVGFRNLIQQIMWWQQILGHTLLSHLIILHHLTMGSMHKFMLTEQVKLYQTPDSTQMLI